MSFMVNDTVSRESAVGNGSSLCVLSPVSHFVFLVPCTLCPEPWSTEANCS